MAASILIRRPWSRTRRHGPSRLNPPRQPQTCLLSLLLSLGNSKNPCSRIITRITPPLRPLFHQDRIPKRLLSRPTLNIQPPLTRILPQPSTPTLVCRHFPIPRPLSVVCRPLMLSLQ